MTGISIPDSVTSIGNFSFSGCVNMTSVELGNGITSIGNYAFQQCSGLTSIRLPDSITKIGSEAFYECSGLTSINIPNGLTTILAKTFADCTSLTSVYIPESVTEFYGSAFSGCTSLTDIYYGGSEAQWSQVKGRFTSAEVRKATVYFDSPASSTSSPVPAIAVTVNGASVEWSDAVPFIDINGRTMVPLRAVADALDLNVSWNSESRMATFSNSAEQGIIFTVDDPIVHTVFKENGAVKIAEYLMDTAAVIRNDRTYAPIRYLAEFFGYTVTWDSDSRTVVIA